MEEVQNEILVLGEKLLEEQVKNKYNEELVASLESKFLLDNFVQTHFVHIYYITSYGYIFIIAVIKVLLR